MQPEKVVRHDDTSRERRLGILLASRENGCPSGLCLPRQEIAKSNFHAEDACSICCHIAPCHLALQQDGNSARKHIQLLALRIGLLSMGGCHAQRLLIMLGLACRCSSEVFFARCRSITICSEKVLHGLLDISVAEKTSLEKKCQFHWPCAGLTLASGVFVACSLMCLFSCAGEVYASILQGIGGVADPRLAVDPARYSTAEGARG